MHNLIPAHLNTPHRQQCFGFNSSLISKLHTLSISISIVSYASYLNTAWQRCSHVRRLLALYKSVPQLWRSSLRRPVKPPGYKQFTGRVYSVVFLPSVCLGSRCSSLRRSDLLEVIRERRLTHYITRGNTCFTAGSFKRAPACVRRVRLWSV